jgi:glutaconate CoA-transferase subunit A
MAGPGPEHNKRPVQYGVDIRFGKLVTLSPSRPSLNNVGHLREGERMACASPEITDLATLARRIGDDSCLAVPPDYSGCAMAAVRELIARPVRNLHVVAVPQAGLQVDMLIGAGCVASVEAAAVSLGEHGPAPYFTEAVKSGEIDMRDSTCPALHAGLQASEKGIPFMPLRGILGSDLLKVRPDWRVIDNPLAEDSQRDPIVILPPIHPDAALFHALKADRHGNVWIGIRRELMLMAHASKAAFVTVERIEDADFLADPVLAAGTIPAIYVTLLAVAKNGAWPVGLADVYPPDHEALSDYVVAAKTTNGLQPWLEAHSPDRVHA